MKKIILCILAFSCSVNGWWGETDAIQKAQANSIVSKMLSQINAGIADGTQPFKTPYDHYRFEFAKNDIVVDLHHVMLSSDFDAVNRSTFQSWMAILSKMASKKGLLGFDVEQPEYEKVEKEKAFGKNTNYSKKEFQKSVWHSRCVKKEQEAATNMIDDADETFVEGPDAASKGSQSAPPVERSTDGATESDDGDKRSDDMEAQMRQNEQESGIQRFLKNYPILRAAGVAGVLLIAYKIYLQAQESNVIVVDSNGKVQKKKLVESIQSYQRK